jgi:hypothetical protein
MFHSTFRTFRPQHPLARLLVGLVGLIAAALLVTLGLFALVVLALGGAIFVLVRAFRTASMRTRSGATPAPSAAAAGVIEGEFTIVSDAPPRDAPTPAPH